MSPEFRISVDETDAVYLRSITRHLKSAKLQEIEQKSKRERKARDPKLTEELALRVREIFDVLPSETTVRGLRLWNEDSDAYRIRVPDQWASFMGNLTHGDKVIIAHAIHALPDTVNDYSTLKSVRSLLPEDFKRNNRSGVGPKSLDFARKIFPQ